jgi:PII-like signaling protein
MTGYQISFYTLQDRKYQNQPVAEWLLEKAQAMGIRGATIIDANESFGSDRRIHAARFFEQAEQPVLVIMIVTEEEAQALFTLIESTQIKLFYTKTAVDFGAFGE